MGSSGASGCATTLRELHSQAAFVPNVGLVTGDKLDPSGQDRATDWQLRSFRELGRVRQGTSISAPRAPMNLPQACALKVIKRGMDADAIVTAAL